MSVYYNLSFQGVDSNLFCTLTWDSPGIGLDSLYILLKCGTPTHYTYPEELEEGCLRLSLS